jgi:hypothetical protein
MALGQWIDGWSASAHFSRFFSARIRLFCHYFSPRLPGSPLVSISTGALAKADSYPPTTQNSADSTIHKAIVQRSTMSPFTYRRQLCWLGLVGVLLLPLGQVTALFIVAEPAPTLRERDFDSIETGYSPRPTTSRVAAALLAKRDSEPWVCGYESGTQGA